MPHADVMALFQEVQRQRGYEMLDAISVSSIGDMEKRARGKVLERARKLTGWSWDPPPSIYESMPTEQRIIALGNCYATGGRKWADEHAGQVDWLTSQGVSLEAAKRRYKDWIEKRMAALDGFTDQPPEKKRRR